MLFCWYGNGLLLSMRRIVSRVLGGSALSRMFFMLDGVVIGIEMGETNSSWWFRKVVFFIFFNGSG